MTRACIRDAYASAQSFIYVHLALVDMAAASVYSSPGFDFSNVVRYVESYDFFLPYLLILQRADRNQFLADRGVPLPKATSTGTTIVGCLYKDGIVLGADTRATEGPIVADKNCEKVRTVRHKARISDSLMYME